MNLDNVVCGGVGGCQGMTLSGGEMPEGQKRIIAGLKSSFPNTSQNYYVCTDTFGSIATAFPNGRQTFH